MFRESMTASLTAFAVLAVGCGGSDAWKDARPKTVPAAGVVTYQGKPVAGAQVNFVPESSSESAAYGVTGEDGEFTLTTFDQNDGAVPAHYQVTISKRSSKTIPNPTDPSGPPVGTEEKSFLPESYGSLGSTPLTADVKADGENQFSFELKD